jgi:hypothetical protein
MENIDIIDTLGKGLYGITYKVKRNNKLYALKRQKILKKYINEGTKYPLFREIKFYSWINKLSNSDQRFFVKLHDYKFYSNCNFKHKKEHRSKLIQNLIQSKHCLDLLIDLKDGVLKKILFELNEKQIMSMILQNIYAIYLMNKNGFIHADLHNKNICYTKIDKNRNIILHMPKQKYTINSYGYKYSIIDYGLVLHKNFILSKEEKDKYNLFRKYNRDLERFFIFTLTNVRYALRISKNDLKIYKLMRDVPINLYIRIKNIIISLYPELLKSYNKWEKDSIMDQILYYQIIQFLAIYDKKILSNFFQKRYSPNLLEAKHLEFIKFNFNNFEVIIDYLYNL